MIGIEIVKNLTRRPVTLGQLAYSTLSGRLYVAVYYDGALEWQPIASVGFPKDMAAR